MKTYTVYMHLFPNCKCYVGITSNTLLHRWGDHGQGYDNQLFMKRAIQKYGWDNIDHVVIAENLTQDEASKMEIELIKYYNSDNLDFGYNVSPGGYLQKPMTEEERKKHSERLRGRKFSDEARARISECRKGENNPFYGKHHSEETKQKLRKLSTGREFSEESRKKISDAHKGKSKSQEQRDKIRKTLMGHTVSEETRKKMSDAKKGKPSPRKGVKLSDETRRRLSEAHKGQVPWNKSVGG